jgi:hypothetical protein
VGAYPLFYEREIPMANEGFLHSPVIRISEKTEPQSQALTCRSCCGGDVEVGFERHDDMTPHFSTTCLMLSNASYAILSPWSRDFCQSVVEDYLEGYK